MDHCDRLFAGVVMARWDYRYLGFERFPDALSALEIEQCFTLEASELAEVGRRRGSMNRLAVASDGTSTLHVSLSVSGESTANGDTRYYRCTLTATGASNSPTNSAADTGFRGVGSLSYQWEYSDNGADYFDLGGATTEAYDDTGAAAPTITAGNATASDGTSGEYVELSVTGQGASPGAARYYRCRLDATGADQQTSTSDDGYRGTTTLTYQWQRSAADSDADYSDLSGGTTNPYNDRGGALAPDGRYYKASVAMVGAVTEETTSDRGYRDIPGRS